MTAHATVLPPEPTVPDLCRAAVKLLDTYQERIEIALRCADEGSAAAVTLRELASLRSRTAAALDALSNAHYLDPVWWARARCAEAGVVEVDAWSIELRRLAAEHEGEGESGEDAS